MPFVGIAIAAISSAVGGAFAAGGFFTTVAGRLLASVALSALSAALAPQQKFSEPGIRTATTASGATNPVSFVIGRYATAGVALTPPMSHDNGNADATPNGYLTYVIDLGDVPGMALDGLLIDGEVAALGEVSEDWGRPVGGRFSGHAWVRFYDGSQTTADAKMLEVYGDYPDRPWTADMVGTGVAYAIVTFKYNRKIFTSFPRVLFVLTGIPLYDPRYDSTVGGAGGQRWDDPATWGPTENPIVQVYNIMRGVTVPGLGVWGGQISADALPLANWFTAMNACDDAVPLAEEGAEPAYRAGFEVSVADEPADVIEQLLKAASAEICEVGGEWFVRVGGPGLPVYFFTDDDVLSSRDQDFDPFGSMSGTYNGVAAQYPDPNQLWETVPAPTLTRSDWEAEDQGRQLIADVVLPAVPYPRQVQRLMLAWLEEERRFRRHSVALPSDAAVLSPLDCVAWSSERNGYIAKVFEVAEVTDDLRSCVQRVGLREKDPSDYDWSPTFELPLPPALGGFVPPTVQAVPGWSVAAQTLLDTEGAPRRVALRFSWHGSGQIDVRGLRWEVRLTETAQVVLRGSTQDVAVGVLWVADGILPGTSYQARAEFIVDRLTAWSDWEGATTADLRLGVADLDDPVRAAIEEAVLVRDAANARADEVLAEAEQAVAGLRLAAETAIGGILEGVTTPILDRVSNLDASMVQRIDDIERIDRDLELSMPRQIDVSGAVDTLAERLAWLQLSLSRFQTDVADAGLYIDPASGKARLEAISRVDGQISEVSIALDAVKSEVSLKATYADIIDVVTAAQLDPADLPIITDLVGRISDAEIAVSGLEGAITAKADTIVLDGVSARVTTAEANIDSLTGQIALRVPTTTFDLLETRVSDAEIVLGSLDVPSLTLSVSDARVAREAVDNLSLAQLQALLKSRAGQEALQADIAYARQDMRSLVDEDRVAMAEIRQEIGVAVADATALVLSEQTARVTETSALAQQADDLAATVGGQAAAISEINRVSADSESANARALRQVQLDVGVVADGVSAQASAISALTGRVDNTEDGLEAEVRDKQILQARVGEAGEEGAVANLRALLADQTARELLRSGVADIRADTWAQVAEDRQAIAGLRQELTVAVADATARIDAERSARVTANEALAQDTLDLRVDLDETSAGLSEESSVRALETGALAERAAALEATVNDPATGVGATSSAVSALTSRVSFTEFDIQAQSFRLDQLESTVDDPSGGVAATSSALDALTTRVTTTEGAIVSQAGSITTLSSSVSVKGRVIYQSAAPDAADRLPQNLWVDTTGGANTPKRWNGSAWVAVTDKVATDAAAAAASALAAITLKADASALTALTTRVEETESGIEALAIDVTRLEASIGDGFNLIAGAELSRANLWTLEPGWSLVSPVLTAGITSSGVLRYVRATGTGLGNAALSQPFTVIEGNTYAVKFQGRATGAGTWSVTARLFWYDAADTFLSASNLSPLAGSGTAIVVKAEEVICPAGAKQARLVFACERAATAAQVDVGGPVVERLTAAVVSSRSAITTLDGVINTPTTGLAARTSSIEAEVRHPTTGLAPVRATVDAQQTAIATIEGHAAATYTLRVGAGGASAGLEIVAADDPISGPAATIRLAADQFIVNGDTFLDDAFIEKVVARQALVDELRVNTLMLKGQAVTIPVHLAWPGIVRPVTSPGANVAAGSIRREGAATAITFGCQFSGPAYGEAVFELRRNGVVINRFAAGTGPNGAAQSVFSQFIDTDTGTGVTNYRVDCLWSGGAQPIVAQRSLSMIQTKR